MHTTKKKKADCVAPPPPPPAAAPGFAEGKKAEVEKAEAVAPRAAYRVIGGKVGGRAKKEAKRILLEEEAEIEEARA